MNRSYSAFAITLIHVALLSSSSHGKRRTCDQGWKSYVNQCFKVIEESLSWKEAWLNCKKHGSNVTLIEIPDKTANLQITDALSGTKLNYWLNINSIVYRSGFQSYNRHTRSKFVWNSTGTGVAMKYTNFKEPSAMNTYSGSDDRCGYLSDDAHWYITSCYTKKRSLCAKYNPCEDGYYGDSCQKLCHCFQAGCEVDTGKCQYGCSAGWTGEKCDTEKKEAKASIYCFDSSIEGKFALIRVNPMNVNYQTISLVNKHGHNDCPKKMFQREKNGIFSIQINMTLDTEVTSPKCPVDSSGKDVYVWAIKTEEIEGFHGYYDRLFELKCDFKVAETLERNSSQTINGEMNSNPIKVNQTREDVELFIQNPVTSGRLSKVKLGSQIILSMVLNKTDEKLSAKGISPYNCKISNVDGTVFRKLIAENGCSENNASVSPFKGSNMTYLSTNSFSAFTLFNHSVVVFSCQFEFCFHENTRLCSDRCSQMRAMRVRWKRSTDFREKSHGSTAAYLHLIESDNTEG